LSIPLSEIYSSRTLPVIIAYENTLKNSNAIAMEWQAQYALQQLQIENEEVARFDLAYFIGATNKLKLDE
jgi:hypothetical protein